MTLSLFFCSSSCCFLFLLSLHLFLAKRGVKLLNYLLALLIFSLFGQLLISLLIHSDQQAIFPRLYQFFTPLWYITPACFYLYVTSFIHGNPNLLKFQWLHFIPAIFAIVHVLPWQLDHPVNWSLIAAELAGSKQALVTERTGLFSAAFYYLGKPALIITYLALTWHAVLKSKILEINRDHPSNNWLLFFLKTSTFFQLAGFLPLLFWRINPSYINTSFMMMNGIALLVILIFVLHQPKLFYGYLFVSVNLDTDPEEIKTDAPATLIPIKKVSLLPDQLLNYSNAMREIMEIKKPYLLGDFQIVDLAGELNIPVHHCSFVLNNLIGKNFREWINEYRIQSFLEQYPVKAHRMTIESIAQECGFKSIATFYNAFRKETGLMPTAYFAQKKVS